ncbi:MAG: DUF4270 domain-containing protein [Sphingobacteriales bacterium]|nr:DUF4270 domain-containing protein [Sphingobacteriales bacterium]
MRFIKTGLLTMLVSLFILGGCKNPSGIGLNIDPNTDINTILVDTSTVITQLQKMDSVRSNFNPTSVLGYFKDPIFGTTTANMAVSLTLPSSNYSFGTNPTLDSAVLVLPFVNFYGDSTNTNYAVEVRQLNEEVFNQTSISYYDNKHWSASPTIIGSANFSAAYRDSITLQDIVAGAKDTVKRVPAQLRIKLDPNFITNNIINLDSLKKIDNKTFNDYFKGLYVSLNKNNTTNNGGLFTFDTNTSGAARLDLFYKTTSTTGTLDTISTSFNIDGASGFAASEISWDLSGSAVETALQNPSTNDILYLNGLNGTQVKLDFPYIQRIKSLGTNVAINRAELELKIVNGTDAPYAPIQQLKIFRWDIAHRPKFVPDEDPYDARYIGAGYIGGYYNSVTKSYLFNLTGYIQDLMSGKTQNYGTFITTSNTSLPSGFGGELAFDPFTLGRAVTGSAKNPTYKARLKIYYTDLK